MHGETTNKFTANVWKLSEVLVTLNWLSSTSRATKYLEYAFEEDKTTHCKTPLQESP